LFHCFCWILGWTGGPAEETSLPSLETWEDRSTTNHPKVIMKFCLLLIIAGLVCGFSGPARAQERNTIDPQVRQEVEALNLKYDEAFNRNDAEAVATLLTADAVETGPEEVASGQQEIEDRYKILFESHPNRHATKLDQVYAIGSRVCAISEWSVMQKKHTSQPMLLKEGYVVTINIREGDAWKIGMLYWSYK
jgi:uncharacterized protein (TIGR02246 family)